jgi:DNA-binding NarL/FixJ family response regulator
MTTMTSHDRVRIIVVEGAEFVRRGICGVLAQHGEPFELAAEISRAAALPQACELLTPDVVVLSLRSEGEYLEDLRMLREALEVQTPALAIVLLEHDGIDGVIEAVRAGANGVLLREASAGTLLAAIHDVLAGGAVLDPRLARNLFARLATGSGAGQGMMAPGMDPAVAGALSRREREVLQALARGYRNKEISMQLGVSVGTVKTHLRHIFRKLHVADRTAAVLIALQGKLPKAA